MIMSTKYSKLDAEILRTIKSGATDFNNITQDPGVRMSVKQLVTANPSKPAFRFVGARLQALRKAGKVRYARRASKVQACGWVVAEGGAA